ncbi:damage-control phosphatase ARMT1-like isoform X2 [Bacillus rossius redtenbacheri]|uniref:damage-control phosphatase ARMT1-like isoform X2 n=1 Tax=Bacillus rossius redtenbacheri TaxID=93214 RepID=UPI002FDE954C
MTVLHLVGVALRLLAHKESVSSVAHAGIEGTINTATPEGVHFSSKYIKSAAHYVVNETFTTVLANFAEDLRQNNITIIRKYGQDAERDIEVALVSLSQLANEIKSNEPFKPLVSNRSDVALWNSFLNEQTKKDGTAVKWYSGTFLYTQCYLYRRVKQIFELSSACGVTALTCRLL